MGDYFNPFTFVFVGIPFLFGMYMASIGYVNGLLISWAIAGAAAYWLYKDG